MSIFLSVLIVLLSDCWSVCLVCLSVCLICLLCQSVRVPVRLSVCLSLCESGSSVSPVLLSGLFVCLNVWSVYLSLCLSNKTVSSDNKLKCTNIILAGSCQLGDNCVFQHVFSSTKLQPKSLFENRVKVNCTKKMSLVIFSQVHQQSTNKKM